MKGDLALELDEYEDKLVGIVRRLPLERVIQLVDFARFLEVESEEEIAASEASWDPLLSQPEAKQKLHEMAHEALEAYHAGETTDIEVAEDGRLAPA
jgi:hypothetical protein